MCSTSVAGDAVISPMASSYAISVVIPTLREAANLERLIPAIATVLAPTGASWEVIIVDDDSRDGTNAVVARHAAAGHPVRLITRVGERGLSSAVIRGLDEARGTHLVCMDADLSHPPAALPRLLAALDEPGVEFVLGSRYVPGGGTDEAWGVLRWVNSRVATLLARPFTNARDPMAGYFALQRSLYDAARRDLNPIGYKIALELIVKGRCHVVREVPIRFALRRHGASKLSLQEQVRYLKHLKRLADFKYGAWSRFVQFCLVGTTGMAVDLAALTVLLGSGVPFGGARALAIWAAMTWNFALNRNFTFREARALSALRQYPRFVAACLAGAVVNWSTSMVLRQVAPLTDHVYLPALAGIAAGTIVNFLGSLLWVFRRERTTVAREAPAARS